MTRIEAAEARSAEARLKLAATVGVLQDRLDPRSVAAEVVDTIADGGRKALTTGVEAARANPGKVAGVIGLIALFLGRRRLAALVPSRGDAASADAPQPARRLNVRSSKPRPAPAKRIPR